MIMISHYDIEIDNFKSTRYYPLQGAFYQKAQKGIIPHPTASTHQQVFLRVCIADVFESQCV